MTERDGIFAGNNPFDLCSSWLDEAKKTEINDPNAIALATVGDDGLPNVRVVLLKSIEDDAFVFYTNYRSQKGLELQTTGKAAFVLHWKSLRRQIRVRGGAMKENGPIADEYFASRNLQSRIGAWASEQSSAIESREALFQRVEHFSTKFGDSPKRPPHWGGFRIKPLEIEFWSEGDFRLHQRYRWSRSNLESPWKVNLLAP